MKGTVTVLICALSLCVIAALSGCGSSSGNSVNDLNLTPISPSVSVAQTVQFTATAVYSNGNKVDITKTAQWSSSATSIATIQSAGAGSPGLATGVAPGEATITVSFNQGSTSISGSTDITVVAAGPAVRPLEGMAPVYFEPAPGVSIGEFTVDGRPLQDNSAFITLPSGEHRFMSADGRYRYSIILEGYRSYTFGLTASGKILLESGQASSGSQ